MNGYALVVGTLAVWRVTHLLTAEDGPGDLVARLRSAAGPGFWGKLLDCFYCLSLWVAAPVAALMREAPADTLLQWLALSAGAILLERLTTRDRDTGAAVYFEDEAIPDPMIEEAYDGLLRR